MKKNTQINQKKLQGKRNRASGARFELKVRKDLESKGWIVSKWMNNVEFNIEFQGDTIQTIPDEVVVGKLVPAKHKFRGPGIPMAIGTGFPDFIAFKKWMHFNDLKFETFDGSEWGPWNIIGVESKSNGLLTKEEKDKCNWLIQNNIFSKILIAKKGTKRGEIIYNEWKIKEK